LPIFDFFKAQLLHDMGSRKERKAAAEGFVEKKILLTPKIAKFYQEQV
jgi:hypothetical protein